MILKQRQFALNDQRFDTDGGIQKEGGHELPMFLKVVQISQSKWRAKMKHDMKVNESTVV